MDALAGCSQNNDPSATSHSLGSTRSHQTMAGLDSCPGPRPLSFTLSPGLASAPARSHFSNLHPRCGLTRSGRSSSEESTIYHATVASFPNGELVEKEDAVVCEEDLAGLGDGTAADGELLVAMLATDASEPAF
jgi:hypothetical protein